MKKQLAVLTTSVALITLVSTSILPVYASENAKQFVTHKEKQLNAETSKQHKQKREKMRMIRNHDKNRPAHPIKGGTHKTIKEKKSEKAKNGHKKKHPSLNKEGSSKFKGNKGKYKNKHINKHRYQSKRFVPSSKDMKRVSTDFSNLKEFKEKLSEIGILSPVFSHTDVSTKNGDVKVDFYPVKDGFVGVFSKDGTILNDLPKSLAPDVWTKKEVENFVGYPLKKNR